MLQSPFNAYTVAALVLCRLVCLLGRANIVFTVRLRPDNARTRPKRRDR